MGKNQSKLSPKLVENLRNETHFTESEIKQWYEDFVKEFPSGRVTQKQFKEAFRRQFANGDPSKLAEHVFRTFDTDQDGSIDFREFMCYLSVTSRSTPEQKLTWAFSMFDVDVDGFVQKDEMTKMIGAIYKAFGYEPSGSPQDEARTPERETERLFQLMDKNRDGKLSLEEFLEGAKKEPFIATLLNREVKAPPLEKKK
ncbi:unnamed protein product [Ixodes persulcatus]